MAAYTLCLCIAASLLLTQPTSAKNDAPCLPGKWNNAAQTFIKRHLPKGTPTSLDQNQWEKFIKSLGGCDRPTQSFLHPDELEKVKSVCSSRGGKVLKDNLCISKQPFSFVTVRSIQGTCGIKSVTQENKHLILACEVLENQCVPVHFEGNFRDQKPSNNARDCQDPETRGQAPTFKVTPLWLFAFMLIFYAF
ncbi:ribonuclease pancreatic-like [Poecilia reticulata]|uniref:ribonuclease pancreatic-like n=1 Tax=Poecilia reticulata TaxID=8081 RepID=UPI0004A3FE0A|nr:PREDICTED: ribonuclease pancreatic-like [Poecilia reticulata]